MSAAERDQKRREIVSWVERHLGRELRDDEWDGLDQLLSEFAELFAQLGEDVARPL